MSLSSPEIASILSGWSGLIGAGVRKVRAVSREPAVLLELRVNSENRSILLSVERGASRLHEIRARVAAPAHPGAFVMLLRKRLVGARLAAIAQLAGDRIVRLAFSRGDAVVHLLAELTGRQANLIFVDDEDRILGCLLPSKSAVRPLTPGRTWTAPASPPSPRGLRSDWPGEPADAFVDAHYRRLVEERGVDALRRRALGPVKKRLARIRRSVVAVERDLERIGGAYVLRAEADLLQQAWGRVERGAAAVTVTDWESGEETTVALDPRLDLNENIQKRYKRYRRLQRGRVHAESRLASLRADEASARGQIEEIEAATPEELADLAPDDGGPTAARGKPAERKPYYEFVASDGTRILVGRGARDNDALTFKVARGNDVWLHAADFAGSHVIIRSGRCTPTRGALEEAALLAAHYSKGRADGVVTVTYTQRKHVRKPRNAPSGRVSIAGGRSIDVRMDAEALARIFATRR